MFLELYFKLKSMQSYLVYSIQYYGDYKVTRCSHDVYMIGVFLNKQNAYEEALDSLIDYFLSRDMNMSINDLDNSRLIDAVKAEINSRKMVIDYDLPIDECDEKDRDQIMEILEKSMGNLADQFNDKEEAFNYVNQIYESFLGEAEYGELSDGDHVYVTEVPFHEDSLTKYAGKT